MHIKYLCTVHMTSITVDKRTDYKPWSHKSEWISWSVRSTDKSQSYSIVRREASCFVSLNAPIRYFFSAAASDSFTCLRILDSNLMYHFIFFGERVRIRYRHSNEVSERISVCNINYYLHSTDYCGKIFKKSSIFHILCAIILKEFWFIKILRMLQL